MKKIILILVGFLIIISGCIGPLSDDSSPEKQAIENVSVENLSTTNQGDVSSDGLEIRINSLDNLSNIHIISESGAIVSFNRSGDTWEGNDGSNYYAVGENETGYYLINELSLSKPEPVSPPNNDDDNDDDQDDENNKNDRFIHTSEKSTWKIVNPRDPQNYNTIQGAIDDANDYFTILVYEGDYSGFTVNKAVNVVGLGDVTITGSGEQAIKIDSPYDYSSVEGLEIRGDYQKGIDITKQSQTKIKDIYIDGPNYGIDARNSKDRWVVEDIVVKNTITGIFADYSLGYPSIKDSRFNNNTVGISIRRANTKQNEITNIDVSKNERRGVRGAPDDSNDIGKVWYSQRRTNTYLYGISRSEKCENVSCSGNINEDSYLEDKIIEYQSKEDSQYRIATSNIESKIDELSAGDLVIVEGNITGPVKIEKDIKLVGMSTDSNMSTSGNLPYCIEIGDQANPTINRIRFNECGINAKGTTQDWRVTNSFFSEGRYGIFASDSSGNWVVEDSIFKNNKYGIWASRSDGDYLVYNNDIVGANIGLRVDDVSSLSSGMFRFNRFETETDIKSTGRSVNNIDVKMNWWGKDGLTYVESSTKDAAGACTESDCLDLKENPIVDTYRVYSR